METPGDRTVQLTPHLQRIDLFQDNSNRIILPSTLAHLVYWIWFATGDIMYNFPMHSHGEYLIK